MDIGNIKGPTSPMDSTSEDRLSPKLQAVRDLRIDGMDAVDRYKMLNEIAKEVMGPEAVREYIEDLKSKAEDFYQRPEFSVREARLIVHIATLLKSRLREVTKYVDDILDVVNLLGDELYTDPEERSTDPETYE